MYVNILLLNVVMKENRRECFEHLMAVYHYGVSQRLRIGALRYVRIQRRGAAGNEETVGTRSGLTPNP